MYSKFAVTLFVYLLLRNTNEDGQTTTVSLSANDLVRELRFLDVRHREYPDQIDLHVRITMCLVQPEKDCQSSIFISTIGSHKGKKKKRILIVKASIFLSC